jgi:hypothetical protein
MTSEHSTSEEELTLRIAVLVIVPVGLEIVFVLCSQDRQIFFPEFWFKTRDTQTIHRASVPWYSFLLFTWHYGATGAL